MVSGWCYWRRPINRRRVAFLLMDIHVPRRDGLTATRSLNTNPVTREIPILAWTANVMSEDAGKAEEA